MRSLRENEILRLATGETPEKIVTKSQARTSSGTILYNIEKVDYSSPDR
jgi:hypothetical protein